MQSHTTSNACSIAQYASVSALTDEKGQEFICNMQKVFDERRRLMIEKLNKIENITYIEPKGAFYVFVNVSNVYGKTFEGTVIDGSLKFADCALKNGIAVIPGIAFGNDECIRLSYAISKEDIEKGLDRLAEFIKKIN